jgi:hypothetical protein
MQEHIKVYTDYKSLEYFMTTKQLTARQVCWAEFLSEYYFQIMYRTGKSNAKADALIYRDYKITVQNDIKQEYRTRAFLSEDQVDPQICKERCQEVLIITSRDGPESSEMVPLQETIALTDRLLKANQEATSLEAMQAQARRSEGNFILEDSLLLFEDRLVVPTGSENLVTELIKEAHTQISTAYPGRDKTYYLLRPCYY